MRKHYKKMLSSIIASLRWYYPVQVMRVIKYSQLKAPLATINFEYGYCIFQLNICQEVQRLVDYMQLT
jgi:hypothetical protein